MLKTQASETYEMYSSLLRRSCTRFFRTQYLPEVNRIFREINFQPLDYLVFLIFKFLKIVLQWEQISKVKPFAGYMLAWNDELEQCNRRWYGTLFANIVSIHMGSTTLITEKKISKLNEFSLQRRSCTFH